MYIYTLYIYIYYIYVVRNHPWKRQYSTIYINSRNMQKLLKLFKDEYSSTVKREKRRRINTSVEVMCGAGLETVMRKG